MTRRIEQLWYTRCPVPTATSIAIDHGFLDREFAPDGIVVSSLRASTSQDVRESHFDHNQADSLREGGNIPPIWTRARGGGTKVIAAGWIDEYQAIIALPGSGISSVADLKGRRIGMPMRLNDTIDYWRAMCLHGCLSALEQAQIGRHEVELVDLPIAEKYIASGDASRTGTLWSGAFRARRQQADAFALIRGSVDAIYTAGAPGAQLAAFLGAEDVIELGHAADPMMRVNNQVPIILTVSQSLLDDRPDLVDRYLATLVAAAEWAKTHRSEVLRTVAADVGGLEEWVEAAYGLDFHLGLTPTLSERALAGLRQQKDFLLREGFIAGDFDLESWIDGGPLTRLGLAG